MAYSRLSSGSNHVNAYYHYDNSSFWSRNKSNIILFTCIAVVITVVNIAVYFAPPVGNGSNSNLQQVQTECGTVEGTSLSEVDSQGTTIYQYLGIPYAMSTAPPNRFKPPVSLKDGNGCWSGVLKATNFAPACPQYSKVVDGEIIGSEDCLAVNIWTAYPNVNKSLPVVVYIHGGSSIVGYTSEPYYNLQHLPQQNVVAVTISYRVAAFGYLALSTLTSHSTTQSSGNYGLMDCIEALRWVQRNIASFGGDPSKVTIIGQSTGGTNVMALVASPRAKGLFAAGIAMSASPVLNSTLAYAEKVNEVFLDKSNCSSNGDAELQYKCLQSLSMEQIMKATPMLEFPYWASATDSGIPTPDRIDAPIMIVDGYILPKGLNDGLSSSSIVNDVPLVYGHTSHEIDFGPEDDLTHYNSSQYETFINQRFSLFNPQLPAKILSLYSYNKFSSAQEAYTRIATDNYMWWYG